MAAVALGNLGKDFLNSLAEPAATTKKAAAVNPGAERPDTDPKATAKPGQNSQGQMAKAAVANQNLGKGGAGNGNSNPGGNGQQTGRNLAGDPTIQAGSSANGNGNPGQVAMSPAFKAALLNTTSHGPAQAATAGQIVEQLAGAPADPAATSITNTGKTIAQVTKIASPRPPVLPQLTGAANQVAMQLAQAVNIGATKFTMRLHPAELGRVDVRLEIAADGRVTAAITADRQETLDLLRNESRVLEKALEQAGLTADSNDLQFGLRDQGNDHARGESNDRGHGTDPAADDMDVVAGTWVGGPSVAASTALDIHV
jgi:flagellar hook-length control protein FliK